MWRGSGLGNYYVAAHFRWRENLLYRDEVDCACLGYVLIGQDTVGMIWNDRLWQWCQMRSSLRTTMATAVKLVLGQCFDQV